MLLSLLLLGSGLSRLVFAQTDLAQQAAALMQAGHYADAEKAWRILVELHPEDPAAHNGLGSTLARQGQLSAAATEYKTSLRLKHHQVDEAYNLGLAESKQGRFTQAVDAFLQVHLDRPDDDRSNMLLGMSYFGLRQYGAAAKYLQLASAHDPTNAELHSVLAQSCLWSKQYDCALKESQSSAGESRLSPGAHADGGSSGWVRQDAGCDLRARNGRPHRARRAATVLRVRLPVLKKRAI